MWRSLTVQMLLLRAYAFLGGSLADGLGESLASKAVTGGQQPVVDRLPCHSHDEAVVFVLLPAPVGFYLLDLINLIMHPRNGPQKLSHSHTETETHTHTHAPKEKERHDAHTHT